MCGVLIGFKHTHTHTHARMHTHTHTHKHIENSFQREDFQESPLVLTWNQTFTHFVSTSVYLATEFKSHYKRQKSLIHQGCRCRPTHTHTHTQQETRCRRCHHNVTINRESFLLMHVTIAAFVTINSLQHNWPTATVSPEQTQIQLSMKRKSTTKKKHPGGHKELRVIRCVIQSIFSKKLHKRLKTKKTTSAFLSSFFGPVLSQLGTWTRTKLEPDPGLAVPAFSGGAI